MHLKIVKILSFIDQFSPHFQNQTGVSDGQGYLEERYSEKENTYLLDGKRGMRGSRGEGQGVRTPTPCNITTAQDILVSIGNKKLEHPGKCCTLSYSFL